MRLELGTSAVRPATPATGDSRGGSPAATSYGEIVTSSTLIGASTALNLLIGLVRTKALAVLLGPAGFGLMGVFTSISDMARNVAGMGVNSSGVRQIADAVGSGDAIRVARTLVVLRRVSLALALLGALLLVALAVPISRLTFGSDERAGALAMLAAAVFMRLIADGQYARMQGMRQVASIAKSGALGALMGALVSVPIVYAFAERGIVPSLIAVAGVSLLASWWWVRRLQSPVEAPQLTGAELRSEVSALLTLGAAFMISGLMTLGAAYAVRLILVRMLDLDAAGLYHAAWTVGGLYVGLILQAMSTDFYPRLVAACDQHQQCNRLVNEQAFVSLLLAGSGLVATMTFAPTLVELLYSADFAAGTELLRWITLGMAIRVISWPVGYILVAKGKKGLFVAIDLTWTLLVIGLTPLLVQRFGLAGAGMAFLAANGLHLAIVFPTARRLSGFAWSAANVRTGLLLVVVAGSLFFALHQMQGLPALALGVLATAASVLYSLHVLRDLVPAEQLPRRLAWLARGRKAAT